MKSLLEPQGRSGVGVGKQTLGWGKVGASPSPLFADTSKDSDLTLG